MKMSNVALAAFLAFLTSIAFFMGTVVYLFQDGPPQLDLSARVVTVKLRAGEDFVVHNRFKGPVDCGAWWHRLVFNYNGAQVMGLSEYRPADSPQEYQRSIHLPADITPGWYSYEAVIMWQCNWVQRLFPRPVDLPTISFEVTR